MQKKNNREYQEQLALKVTKLISGGINSSSAKEDVLNKYKDILEAGENTQKSKVKKRAIIPFSESSFLTRDFEHFEFKARIKEYFKLWYKNFILTLLTFGIYGFWAKQKEQQYFWASTFLHGANFYYEGKIFPVFFSSFIVLASFISFVVITFYSFSFYLQGITLAIAILSIPWYIYEKVKYNITAISYRGVKLSYQAPLVSYYILSALIIIPFIALAFIIYYQEPIDKYLNFSSDEVDFVSLVVIYFSLFSFFIYYPFIYKKYKDILINYSSFGRHFFSFRAEDTDMIFLFFKVNIIVLLTLVALGFITFYFMNLLLDMSNGISPLTIYLAIVFIYFMAFSFLRALVDGFVTDFTLNHTRLKSATFKSSINPWELAYIGVSNALLMLFSLGLLYPYVKLRYLRYKVENSAFSCLDFSKLIEN